MRADVIVVGAGPAGATCGAFCAMQGLRTTILDRAQFPREKVCGDCLNPAAWPVLERLKVGSEILQLAISRFHTVQIGTSRGRNGPWFEFPVPTGKLGEPGEIGIRRSLLDAALLDRARSLGAEIHEGGAVTDLTQEPDGWSVHTAQGTHRGRYLIAADGRNSSVCRQLRLLPKATPGRVALQTHFKGSAQDEGRVLMRLHRTGYSGLASVGDGWQNLCLVSRPQHMDALKAEAMQEFQIPDTQSWRAIAPLDRAPLPAFSLWPQRFLAIGDSARVVEPFTGEGISYAIQTGEAAARLVAGGNLAAWPEIHASFYRGRLWINQVARQAVLHPRVASFLLHLLRPMPWVLAGMTAKVLSPRSSRALFPA